MSHELSAELDFAMKLTKELGGYMYQQARIGHPSSRKEDYSHLTKVDTDNNAYAIRAIRAAFANDGIRGEEEQDVKISDKRRWILDPVDGTFPFSCGIGTSVILLALEEAGEISVGVTYDPYMQVTFAAARNMGAYIHENRRSVTQRVQLREQNTLLRAPIGTTGPDPSNILDLHSMRAGLGRQGAKIQVIGSTGHEMVMVGTGQFSGQIFGGQTAHDIAAGDLFVREAGGITSDLRGNTLGYSNDGIPPYGSVMAPKGLHDILLEAIEPHLL